MRFEFMSTLKRLREKMGVTQAEMADLSGLTQPKISQIENGRLNAEISTLQAFAAATDAELVIVPRKVLPKVKDLVENFLEPAPNVPAFRSGGVADELFIPDPEDEEEEPADAWRGGRP